MTSELEGKKRSKRAEPKPFKQASFINHSFTEDDKKSFKGWMEKPPASLGDMLDKLFDDGYNISIKHDAFTDAAACFIQPANDTSPNAGFILTGRSHSPTMAVGAALYRHYVLFEGEWPVRDARSSLLDDE